MPLPPDADDSGTCHTEVVVFGATLGRDWLGFDSNRTNNYSTGLDVTLPLYVTWIYTDDESLKCLLCLQYGPHDVQSQNLFRIHPPIGLSEFVPWFKDADGTTHEDKFFVTAAAFGDDLDPSTGDLLFDSNYIPCPGRLVPVCLPRAWRNPGDQQPECRERAIGALSPSIPAPNCASRTFTEGVLQR